MVVLTLKAKHDHLQKVATTRDHVKAISEFVWNALDGDAKRTSVDFARNALGGLEAIICPGRVVKDLTLRVIEWKPRVTARKIYFGGETGVVLGSLAANVTAPGFEFSAYAYSPFFNEIAKANLLEFDGLTDPDFARVLEYVRDRLTDYFRFRQAEKSGELIQDLKAAGVYPYEGEPRDEVERHERQVFDITTHAVASYSRDFKKADNPLKKITLGLLREAVSNNPESVSRILKAVFNLPKVRQDEFSHLLEKTELDFSLTHGGL